jgi:hypothetical protein
MAYDRIKVLEDSKKLIVEHNLFFIEDIISMLPCTKPTFYDFFKVDSDELNHLKQLLELNKVILKISMRKKWNDSENATLQMALMKLICTDEERKMLAMTYQENKTETTIIDPSKIIFDE